MLPSSPSPPLFHHILHRILSFVPVQLKCKLYEWCFKLDRKLGRQFSLGIARLPFGLLLKMYSGSTANEAAAMRLVNALQGVRTPYVVDSTTGNKHSWLLASWVEGPNLQDVWDDLSDSDKDAVVTDLSRQIQEMRRQTTKPSSHPISDVLGGPLEDHRIPWASPQVYKSHRDFAENIWVGLKLPHIKDSLSPTLRTFIDRDVPIVFTHGDLRMRNILIPVSVEHWRASGEPLCIIDWETAGWAPSYWEALKGVWLEFEKDTPWTGVIRKVFPEFQGELDADWRWRSESGISII